MKRIMKFYTVSLFACAALWTCANETLIASWDFSGKNIHSADGSIPMYLRGNTRIHSDQNGAYLSIGNTPAGKAQGLASRKIHKKLSPEGAFRIEVKFRLRDTPCNHVYLRLFDTKNVNYSGKNPQWHHGFLLELVKTKTPNQYRPGMSLGFGNGQSESCYGTIQTLLPGRIYTLGASYNGKNAVTFTLDGKVIRVSPLKKEYRSVSAPVNRVVIGDRVGSSYLPFNGDIFSVKLFKILPSPEISADRRRAFYRNHSGQKLMCRISNPTDEAVSDLVIRGEGMCMPSSGDLRIKSLAPGEKRVVYLPVETRLQKGRYPLTVTAAYLWKGIRGKKTLKTELLICPEPKDIMPIEFELATDSYYIPVTHVLRQLGTVYSKYEAREELIESYYRELDELMYNGYFVMNLTYTGKLPKYMRKYPRVDRSGKPYKALNMDASHPEIRTITEQLIRKTAETFGEHPAFTGASINSEVRDRSAPSFTKHNILAYKKYSGGKPIPDEVTGKLPPHYLKLPSFPVSRIVRETDPLLQYYTYFWKTGDGWNDYQSLIADTFRKGIRRPFDTEHHPGVRVPPLWGSGGNVSWINHWTYVNPDPLNIGVNTTELQAMARGVPGQKVKTMTTLIVYRSITAPRNGSKNPPAWVKEFPEAVYITAPPDLIREALFVQLSRHVEAISFHGYDTLDRRRRNLAPSYKNTNPETKIVLADFLNRVVLPYGPVLKRLPERPTQLAVLESFASSIFAHRGSWGWYGWIFDFQLMLQWANLPAKVIYEEEILRSGFGDVKILFMPHCDVLPEKVFHAIQQFQRNGGIVVTDQYHVPGLLPDLVIPQFNRSRKPDVDKKAFQNMAAQLKKNLKDYYVPYADSSNADLLTRVRSDKGSDYLFVINDKRTFGDYVGRYGLVMEKGLPNTGVVTLQRKTGAVYDLLTSKKVPFSVKNGRTLIPVQFRTNGGKILLLMDSPVEKVVLHLPGKALRGNAVKYSVRIRTADGKELKALHPLKVEIRNSKGVLTDDSTFGALIGGRYEKCFTPPLNGEKGLWSITVRDLASGKSVTGKVAVE